MSTELQTINQEVKQFAGSVLTEIKTKEDSAKAVGMLVAITKKRKEVEKFFKDKFIDPAKALLKSHQDEAKIAIQPLNDAETLLRKQLGTYQAAEAARLKAEQDKLNEKYAKKVEKAIAKGKDVEDIPPPVVVQEQAKTTKTEDGGVTFRTVKKLVIFDESVIPDTFMVITKSPNKTMIKAALQANQSVPGCRLEEEQELAVKAG